VKAESRRLNQLERTVLQDRDCLAKKQRERGVEREKDQSEANQWQIKETMKPKRGKKKEPLTVTIVDKKQMGKRNKDTKAHQWGGAEEITEEEGVKRIGLVLPVNEWTIISHFVNHDGCLMFGVDMYGFL
jgi:hypothetical protein